MLDPPVGRKTNRGLEGQARFEIILESGGSAEINLEIGSSSEIKSEVKSSPKKSEVCSTV